MLDTFLAIGCAFELTLFFYVGLSTNGTDFGYKTTFVYGSMLFHHGKNVSYKCWAVMDTSTLLICLSNAPAVL